MHAWFKQDPKEMELLKKSAKIAAFQRQVATDAHSFRGRPFYLFFTLWHHLKRKGFVLGSFKAASIKLTSRNLHFIPSLLHARI